VPELPEVETTRRALEKLIGGHRVVGVHVYQRQLRYPVTDGLGWKLRGEPVVKVGRRGKYLLLDCRSSTVLIHLGMSGSLCVLPCTRARRRHDHVEFEFDHGRCLRLHDPRRFGMVLLLRGDVHRHRLLKFLGPEPFAAEFSGSYLYQRSRGRRQAVKNFLMDGRIVAGLGNIYVNEALFRAAIDPRRCAGRVALKRYEELACSVRDVLQEAIRAGGTTLRDFASGAERPGYFSVQLQVYGREHQPCPRCASEIRKIRQGQRSTYYCPRCQR